MAKKRDNSDKSVDKPEKPVNKPDKSTNAPKIPKTGMWIILGILIVVIIALVLFIALKGPGKSPCEKAGYSCSAQCSEGKSQKDLACSDVSDVCCSKKQDVSPCENYGNACYNGSCPYGLVKLDMGCYNSGVCCKNVSVEDTPCKKAGNICLNGASCPTGYDQVTLGCIFGEVCCKKVLTQCESQGYECEDSCDGDHQSIGLTCTAGQTCCRWKIDDRSECNTKGYSCQHYYCNTGYSEVGICEKNYPCCKRDTSTNKTFIYGFVKLRTGNCMPPVNSNTCKLDQIDSMVSIYPKVLQSDMDGPYYRTAIEPVIQMRSIKNEIVGYYELEVSPGEYSVFAADPLFNKEMYCNSFSSNGYACYVQITTESKQLDLIIDHSTN